MLRNILNIAQTELFHRNSKKKFWNKFNQKETYELELLKIFIAFGLAFITDGKFSHFKAFLK